MQNLAHEEGIFEGAPENRPENGRKKTSFRPLGRKEGCNKQQGFALGAQLSQPV